MFVLVLFRTLRKICVAFVALVGCGRCLCWLLLLFAVDVAVGVVVVVSAV